MIVERRTYRENGLRLLFASLEDLNLFVQSLSERIPIKNAGPNIWLPDREKYPYFITIAHLEDTDYVYLDKLIGSFNGEK
jgi:hypothetical protein